MSEAAAISAALQRACTQTGEPLADLCAGGPVLLVFLRHAGCSFCREAVADLEEASESLHRAGVRIVLVHLGDEPAFAKLVAAHNLAATLRIADPTQELYRAFGLKRGRAAQLFGAKVLWRALWEGVLFRYGLGKPAADPAQLPGVFFIQDGLITRRFRHRTAADRPDYLKIAAR